MSITRLDFDQRAPSAWWVRSSVPEDAPAIIALMRGAGLQPDVAPEHLHWKYWRERADWPGSRSFVLTNGRDLLAHIAVVAGTMRVNGIVSRIVHPIDWAANPGAVGAGVRVMRHLSGVTDFLICVGGSSDTLKIMPRMGYRQMGDVIGYVRTISPLGILRRPGGSQWKRVPRIARSLMWSLSAPQSAMNGWQVRQVKADALATIVAALRAESPGVAVLGRSTVQLQAALSCPIVPTELYVLERSGRIGGYILMSYAPGQARLAAWGMDSEEPLDWSAAAYAAVDVARARGGVAELVVWSSVPAFAQVLTSCGFHARLTLPIFLQAGDGQVMPSCTLQVQMLDSDAYYLYFGGNELWA